MVTAWIMCSRVSERDGTYPWLGHPWHITHGPTRD